MSFDRRSFLKGLILGTGALAAGANAAVLDVLAPNKYRALVDLQHKIIFKSDLYRNAEHGPVRVQAKNEVMALASTLFDLLLADFPVPPSPSRKVQFQLALLMNEPNLFSIDTMSEQDLEAVENEIVNIAVVRRLLAYHMVPIEGTGANWRQWVAGVKHLLIDTETIGYWRHMGYLVHSDTGPGRRYALTQIGQALLTQA